MQGQSFAFPPISLTRINAGDEQARLSGNRGRNGAQQAMSKQSRPTRSHIRLAAALGLALGSGTLTAVPGSHPATAQEIGDPATGRRLAETWCSSCHVIGPDIQRGTSYGAPTFTAIARTTAMTPMALRVFLQTPHSRMPDLHLSRQEIDDVSAYIFSLK